MAQLGTSVALVDISFAEWRAACPDPIGRAQSDYACQKHAVVCTLAGSVPAWR